MSQHNAIGKYAQERIEKGQLVEDNVTISLFEAYFYTVHNQGKRMLLDGYPRTIPQLRDLFRLATIHNRSLMGIYLTLPDEVAVERILGRARPGETEEIVRVRLQEFHQHTAPILEEFKKEAPLHEISSVGTIDEVAQQIAEIVEKY
jgi:adenylate kinase